MKTIVIGALAFIIWSAVSTYWYVNRIKVFEEASASAQLEEAGNEPEQVDISEPFEVAEEPAEKVVENPSLFTLRHEFDQTDFIEKASLSAFMEQTSRFLEKEPNSQLHISGHTDSFGSSNYNLDLSMKRARTVRDFLTANGIAEARIQVHAMGEEDPLADNATEEGRALNRRTTIEIK